MIISGDFIAINSKEDFVPFEDNDFRTPDVIWFNIRNIVSLSCYKDYYRLIIDDEHMVELRQPAANGLIELIRKERDERVQKVWENLSNEDKKKAKKYFEHYRTAVKEDK